MPRYETVGDRLQEDNVSNQLRAAWNLDVWSLPPYTTTGDLLLGKDGMLRAICEVKRRYNPLNKYETYIISRSKLGRISAMAEALNTKGLLVVQFDDVLAWHDATDALAYETKSGGRYDREDPNDIELMVHIPIEKLRRIREATNG
jgi:hypothetical protein|tara:strand:+ start:1041 stop:1478 length:438 start_codon:yes stop_codon:yes gene_type:complete